MMLSALVRTATAVFLLLVLTSTGATAKGGDRTAQTCAQMQAMMAHGFTGEKHPGDGPGKRAKLEKKMAKKGC